MKQIILTLAVLFAVSDSFAEGRKMLSIAKSQNITMECFVGSGDTSCILQFRDVRYKMIREHSTVVLTKEDALKFAAALTEMQEQATSESVSIGDLMIIKESMFGGALPRAVVPQSPG